MAKDESKGNVFLDPILDSLLKKKNGEGWSITDFDLKNSTFNCQWTTFKATTGKEAPMCIHSFDETVSGTIKSTGRFHHCDVLPEIWNDSNLRKKRNSIYLEIGANIGSCVMEMLLSTDALIVAFEPHPMNQFNLRQTLTRLDKVYSERVALVPIGLGDETATTTIFSAKNNMGNSNIDSFVGDNNNQKASEDLQFEVYVNRLDSILKTDELHIPLVKMDAQGYECKILGGMGNKIAQSIEVIKFGFESKWLRAKGCVDHLLPMFRTYGFETYLDNKLVETIKPPKKFCEMIAKKKLDY